MQACYINCLVLIVIGEPFSNIVKHEALKHTCRKSHDVMQNRWIVAEFRSPVRSPAPVITVSDGMSNRNRTGRAGASPAMKANKTPTGCSCLIHCQFMAMRKASAAFLFIYYNQLLFSTGRMKRAGHECFIERLLPHFWAVPLKINESYCD